MNKTNILILPAIENLTEIVSGLKLPLRITKGRYSNLEFIIKDNYCQLLQGGVDLKSFEYAWISSFWATRDLAYAVGLYLDYYHIAHTFIEQSSSKITDQVIFALNNLNVPNSFYIERIDIEKYITNIENTCGYPVIIKDVKGARGKNSALCNNRKELISKLALLPKHNRYQFQSYIANDYDWGVLIGNGKVLSAEKSYHCTDEFRNHHCNGAEEIFVPISEVPDNVKELALSGAKELNLTWARADILIAKDTNKAYLLEVNRMPGITLGSTEVTGARQYLEAIYEKLR